MLDELLPLLDVDLDALRWQLDARCAEPCYPQSMFYPERGDDVTAAKAVCAGCAVRVECLEYALAQPTPFPGVWGGLSERERRQVRSTGHAARAA